MILQWQHSLDIGVPVIDAEHRYLVSLINNLHDRIHSGDADAELGSIFMHLLRYTQVHFRNEEVLMEACGYPGLAQHREQHELLIDDLEVHSEAFLKGSNRDRGAVIDFLRDWVINHVVSEDQRIGTYLAAGKFIPNIEMSPAFQSRQSSQSDAFKCCTYCDRSWSDFDSLVSDDSIEILEPMIDRNNHFFNLLLFNCSCGTTLALQLSELMDIDNMPFELEERASGSPAPAYCLNEGRCLDKCACRFTHGAFTRLRGDRAKPLWDHGRCFTRVGETSYPA